MICIICECDVDDTLASKEHIFPEGIGGTITTNRVCRDCNSKMGSSVDAPLINHFAVKWARLHYGIKGKAKEVPQPLKAGETSDGRKVILRLKGGWHNLELDFLDHVVDDGHGNHTIIVDAKNADKLPKMVNKIRTRSGQLPLAPEEIIIEDITGPCPPLSFKADIDLIDYQRGILKIAYEIAWKFLGNGYLDDPTGRRLRECFLDDGYDEGWLTKYGISGAVRLSDTSHFFEVWEEDKESHLALVTKSAGNKIQCKVRIFNLFEAAVIVSVNARQYPAFNESMFLAISPRTGEVRESTLPTEAIHISGAQKQTQ